MAFFSLIGAVGEALSLHVVRRIRVYLVAIILVTGLAVGIGVYLVPSSRFPEQTIVEVREGESVAEIAADLQSRGLISSGFLFRALSRLTGADDAVQSGRYLFTEPVGSVVVLWRLAHGEYGIPTVRVTFPEGITVREMGTILKEEMPAFDEAAWNDAATELEGYLFPDTYNFLADATPAEVIERMQGNFDERTEELRAEAARQSLDFTNIVIMASIIEGEANTEDDRHLVSGILWNRIKEDVALQVDATFGYIHGVSDYVPTGDDPEVESPYNTYLNRGLPPGAIGNPGLEALDAALRPKETEYFYYLTGRDGKMYYAESFEEHKRNREQYLD